MKVLAALPVLAACAGDIDPAWQLDHDRIIAVRATPPHIPSDTTSQIDVLVGHKGAPTTQQAPDQTTVVSPLSLAPILSNSGTIVTAPGEDMLAAARTELGLAADAPVPLTLGVLVGSMAATKIVWLGDSADNPSLDSVTVNGVTPPASITVPPDVDVPLFIDVDDAVDTVNWLSSCGTMHDFDLHTAHLHVLPTDPQSGEFAIVLRDASGGVSWQVWPIQTQ